MRIFATLSPVIDQIKTHPFVDVVPIGKGGFPVSYMLDLAEWN